MKTALVTGANKGIGLEVAKILAQKGFFIYIGSRNLESGLAAVEKLKAKGIENIEAIQLDVTDQESINTAHKTISEKSNVLDVLVNNAGVGYFGSFEESDLDEARNMFEINVWGLTAMTRAVLPGMRARRSGHIVNISSVGGIAAFPALSFYNASKFAVEALSESLSQEVAPLGIKVLIVEPGPFRTDWAGRSANQASSLIDDYKETAGARTSTIRGYSGSQPGDPVRAAHAIVQIVEADQPPLRLLLGKVALTAARSKVAAMNKDFDGWSAVSESADFPQP